MKISRFVGADVEAGLRAGTMEALLPWFDVAQEVPVRLRDGTDGRVDVLAVPRDSRFSQFAFAIEEKAVSDMTDRLAARIRQAADYVGCTVIRSGLQIGMVFLDLKEFEVFADPQSKECQTMMRVAHQFFVGGLYSNKGLLRLSCGPDDIWRQRPWAGTDDNWAGRAVERLTSTRQSAGCRRGAFISAHSDELAMQAAGKAA
jgi:hypothetical protein